MRFKLTITDLLLAISTCTIAGAGCLVIFGWLLHMPILLAEPNIVKPASAFCLILGSISLLSLWFGRRSNQKKWSSYSRLVAVPIIVISLISLAENLCHWTLGLEELIGQYLGYTLAVAKTSRIGPTAAIALCAFGIGQIALSLESKQSHLTGHLVNGIALVVSVLALIGHLYEVPFLYGLKDFPQMVFFTSLALSILSISTAFVFPEEGLLALPNSASIGGSIARRSLPFGFVIPVILGWFILSGQIDELYPPSYSIAIVVVSMIVLSVLFIYWLCTTINKEESAKQLARLHEQSKKQLSMLMKLAPDGIVIVNESGEIVLINSQTEAMFNYGRNELIGQPLEMLIPERVRSSHVNHRTKFFLSPQTRPMGSGLDLYAMRKDGSEFPVEISLSPIETEDGLLVFGSIRDITKRKHLDIALREAMKEISAKSAELTRANSELQDFAYVAAHDLQEPLRVLSGYAGLLSEHYDDKLEEKGKKYISQIVDASTRMKTLITDLLSYGRISAESLNLQPTDCSLLVSNVARHLKESIDATGCKLICEPLPIVKADPARLCQVFENIIANAIKFRRMEPLTIHVSAKQQDNLWQFTIKDNGIGLAKQNFERIFRPFQRLHTSNEYPGTGIGLAICKKTIELHGGSIWVDSELRKGSSFYFTLPAE